METTTGRSSRDGLFFLLALAFLARQVSAQVDNHGVTFLYPVGDNLTLYYLDTLNTTYTSPFASPLLYIFCDSGNDFSTYQRYRPSYVAPANAACPSIPVRSQPAAPFNGSTLVLLNWTSSTPCYFDLRPDTQAGHGANSDSFTLEVDVKGQTTAGLEPPPATSASTTSSTTTSSTATSSSAAGGAGGSAGASSPSTTSSASSGLSAGAAAGIGIGVGLLVILLAAAAGAWFWRRRKTNSAVAWGGGFKDGKNAGGGVGPVEADGGSTTYGYHSAWQSQSATPAPGEAAEQKAACMPGGGFGRVNELENVPVPQELSA